MSDANACTSGDAPRPAHHFDEAKLTDWMTANVAGFVGPLTVEKFAGGQSNPTFKVTTSNRCYVLRRKPPGKLIKGAHAIDREARVMQALEPVGFPVPHVHAICTDDAVIGSWFYVMDLVEGRIFWDSTFPGVPNAEKAKYFDAMGSAIARLHKVDYGAIGLADYGRPEGFFARQIARWSRQYLQDTEAGRLDDMDMLVEWLPANIPPGEDAAVTHGDFRCDNMIFHLTEPRIAAVLDWELSTIGHPLADFTYHLMMYRVPPSIVGGLEGVDLAALGLPSEDEYVAAYCRRTGRSGIDNLDFYLAYNMFRLAAIIHGIQGRLLRGNAASADADLMISNLPILASRARKQAERAIARHTTSEDF